MQDFIRVGIPNAAERVRIGQGTLQSVILREQPRSKLLVGSLENLQSARIVPCEPLAAAEYLQRGPAFRSSLGQRERTGINDAVRQGGPASLASTRPDPM